MFSYTLVILLNILHKYFKVIDLINAVTIDFLMYRGNPAILISIRVFNLMFCMQMRKNY